MTGIDSVQTHPGSLLAYDGAGNRTISGLDARPLGGVAGGDPLAWYDTLTPVSKPSMYTRSVCRCRHRADNPCPTPASIASAAR